MGCFCFGEDEPQVQVGSKGEEIYRYPSGNVAAVIHGGSMSSFYEDSDRGRLLCCFSSQGEGKVYYETGHVRVSLTRSDCTFFAPNGQVTKKWTWPRLLKQPEEIRLGERIKVTIIDGDNIVTKLTLQKNGRATEFESGRAAMR